MENLFIAHSIFLTREERYALADGKKTIETVGISVPTWSDKSEISKEVLCRYLVTNEIESESVVESMPDGYKIYIKDISKCQKLKDIKDEGSEWLSLKEERNHTFHQIVIQKIEDLERTSIHLRWK